MDTQLFNYNGNNVSFRNENQIVYVNATEMAKNFDKQVKHWFENPSTHEYIHTLARHKGLKAKGENPTSLNTSDLAKLYPSLVFVVKGGLNPQGTWMNEDVAIEFARWLNPSFAIWCNDRIKELMKFGFTATDQTIENFVNNPDLLIEMATALKSERAKSAQSEKQLVLANQTISAQAPLVKLAEDCYSSTETMTTTILSTRLGYASATSLNRKLKELGVQYKIDNCWKLHAKYEGKGYTKTIPVPYKMKSGEMGTQNQMEWLEAGFIFLRGFLAKKLTK